MTLDQGPSADAGRYVDDAGRFWMRYEDQLLERAEEFGFSPTTVLERINEAKAQDTRLMLVRRFNDPLSFEQSEQLANLENNPQVEARSTAEKARDLGSKMTNVDVQNLITEKGLAITKKSVAERLKSLLDNPAESKLFFDANGELTAEGERLFTLALLAKAYPIELVNEVSMARSVSAQVAALRDAVPQRLRLQSAIDDLQLQQDLKQQLQTRIDRLYDDWRDAEQIYEELSNDPRTNSDFSNITELTKFRDDTMETLVRSMHGNNRKASGTAMRKMFDSFYKSLLPYASDLVADRPLAYGNLVTNHFSVGDIIQSDPNQGTLFSLRPAAYGVEGTPS